MLCELGLFIVKVISNTLRMSSVCKMKGYSMLTHVVYIVTTVFWIIRTCKPIIVRLVELVALGRHCPQILTWRQEVLSLLSCVLSELFHKIAGMILCKSFYRVI